MNFTDALQDAKTKKTEIDDRIFENLKIFDGEPYGNEVDGKSKIVWKLIKKQVMVLSANLAKPFVVGDKIVTISPRTKYDTIKARLDEKLINHFYSSEFDNNKFIKMLVNVLAKEGTAFIKTSWIKSTRSMEANGKKFTRTIYNKPFAEVVPNEYVFTDPVATSISDSRFIILKRPVTKEDLLDDPLFDNERVESAFAILESLNQDSDSIHERSFSETADDDDDGKKFIYEFWSKDDKGVFVEYHVGSDEGNDAQSISNRKYIERDYFPFVSIQLFTKEFDIWGIGLPEIIDDEQRFMTSIVRGVIDNMAMSNNGTKFVKKGALDSTNLKRLMTGSPLVEVNSTSNIRDVVYDGLYNELPSSVYNLLQIIETQAEGLTGVSRTIQGISSKDLNSPASNFSSMINQSQIRLLDFMTNIKFGLKEMFIQWLKLMYKYLDNEEIFKITGMDISELKTKETMKLAKQFGIIDDGGDPQVDQETYNEAMIMIAKEVEDIFNKDDIVYDIDMEIGSEGAKSIKIQEINMLLQQLLPLVGSNSAPTDMVNRIISKLFELLGYPKMADEIKTYKPQVDPVAQKMALEKEMAEIEQSKAKAQKEAALAQNAMARTQLTAVKAKKDIASIEPEVAQKYMEVAQKAKEVNGESVERPKKANGNA